MSLTPPGSLVGWQMLRDRRTEGSCLGELGLMSHLPEEGLQSSCLPEGAGPSPEVQRRGDQLGRPSLLACCCLHCAIGLSSTGSP